MTERSGRGSDPTLRVATDPFRILRTYPTRSRLPWLNVLLETLHEIGTATHLDALGALVATRGRDLFGPIPVALLIADTDGWRRLPSPSADHLPEFVSSDAPGGRYLPGAILAIDDVAAYANERPGSVPWFDAGIAAVVAAAFGPREDAQGYVAFFLPRRSDFSEDELTLLAIVANAAGLAVDRIRAAR